MEKLKFFQEKLVDGSRQPIWELLKYEQQDKRNIQGTVIGELRHKTDNINVMNAVTDLYAPSPWNESVYEST